MTTARRAAGNKPATRQYRVQKPYPIYMDDTLVAAVDDWRARQEGNPSRADAIRRMAWRVIRAEQAVQRNETLDTG